MAGKVFFLGDPHLKHKKIPKSRGFETVDEHDIAVIDSIFQTCGRDDSLVITGDTCFGGPDAFIKLMRDGAARNLPKMHGKVPDDWRPNFNIKVTQGNHDSFSMLMQLFLSEWISKFGSLFEYKMTRSDGSISKVIVTHVPVLLDRWEYNVHGHWHSRKVGNPDYLNSSWDHLRRPATFEELLQFHNGESL